MQEPPFVFDVTHQDFQTAVLDSSRRLPVLVDFWAAWCQPCQILMPLLKRLAVEAQGAFLLAKVNADQEPELAARCGVRGLPTVKVFRNGEAVEDLIGVQPESVYRSVIERYRIKAGAICAVVLFYRKSTYPGMIIHRGLGKPVEKSWGLSQISRSSDFLISRETGLALLVR